MSEELNQCPWCKKDVSITSVEDSTYYWCITCEDCDFSWFVLGTRKEVIEKWNRRPAEDALVAEVEQLKDFLQKILDRVHSTWECSAALDDIEILATKALGNEPSPTLFEITPHPSPFKNGMVKVYDPSKEKSRKKQSK